MRSDGENHQLTEVITVRCTSAEKTLIQAAAKSCGQSVSEFVRTSALARAVACPVFGAPVEFVEDGPQPGLALLAVLFLTTLEPMETQMSYSHFTTDCGVYHGLVRDFGGARPPITVLCGSTRFFEDFRTQNLRLTMNGHIVLSIGCDTKSDGDLFGVDDVEALKDRLDDLHKRKIDLADEVLVLNRGGYIGSSTRSEIDYAEKIGKPVEYLEPVAVSL